MGKIRMRRTDEMDKKAQRVLADARTSRAQEMAERVIFGKLLRAGWRENESVPAAAMTLLYEYVTRDGFLLLQGNLFQIPPGTEYHAHRYDTDDEMVLHIWDNDGHSYDITAPRPEAVHIIVDCGKEKGVAE